MRIGLITTHITPAQGYGGVAANAGKILKSWSDAGYSPSLCSSDASMERKLEKAQLEDLYLGTKISLYRAQVFKRWGFGLGAVNLIWHLCRNVDVVYINGIATWPCTLSALFAMWLNRPYVVALRGGMMKDHINLIKKQKPFKWIFYKLLTFPLLKNAKVVHVASEREAKDLKGALQEITTVVIPNGVEVKNNWSVQKICKPMKLCYVGRISREKGINRFIRIWLGVKQKDEVLVIAGTGAGSYFKEFLSLVHSCNGSVMYLGEIEAYEVQDLIVNSNFLVLPSGIENGGERENFGNVVAEALVEGRPVLISRGLAWDHLVKIDAGIFFSKREESIVAALNIAKKIYSDHVQYRKMCKAARSYAETEMDVEYTSQKLYELCENYYAKYL